MMRSFSHTVGVGALAAASFNPAHLFEHTGPQTSLAPHQSAKAQLVTSNDEVSAATLSLRSEEFRLPRKHFIADQARPINVVYQAEDISPNSATGREDAPEKDEEVKRSITAHPEAPTTTPSSSSPPTSKNSPEVQTESGIWQKVGLTLLLVLGNTALFLLQRKIARTLVFRSKYGAINNFADKPADETLQALGLKGSRAAGSADLPNHADLAKIRGLVLLAKHELEGFSDRYPVDQKLRNISELLAGIEKWMKSCGVKAIDTKQFLELQLSDELKNLKLTIENLAPEARARQELFDSEVQECVKKELAALDKANRDSSKELEAKIRDLRAAQEETRRLKDETQALHKGCQDSRRAASNDKAAAERTNQDTQKKLQELREAETRLVTIRESLLSEQVKLTSLRHDLEVYIDLGLEGYVNFLKQGGEHSSIVALEFLIGLMEAEKISIRSEGVAD